MLKLKKKKEEKKKEKKKERGMSDFLLEVALGMPRQIALTCETSVAVRKSTGKWCLENIYASDGR